MESLSSSLQLCTLRTRGALTSNRALWNFVRCTPVSCEDILSSASVGTAFTIDFASSVCEPLGGVVLIGTMASATNTLCTNLGSRALHCIDLLTSVDRVARVTAPVLMIHGTKDSITPLSNAVDLACSMQEAGIEAELVVLDCYGLQETWDGHSYIYAQYNPVTISEIQC